MYGLDRIDGTLYPTCITGYVVTDQGTRPSTPLLTSTQRHSLLNAAGFPYCVSIRSTVNSHLWLQWDLWLYCVGSSISHIEDPGNVISFNGWVHYILHFICDVVRLFNFTKLHPPRCLLHACSFNLSVTDVVVLCVNIQVSWESGTY